jgi:hypothetical protein
LRALTVLTTSPDRAGFQLEFAILGDRFHEGIGDVEAMVQVQALAVEVAGGFADFEEFLDFRVVHVQIDRRRSAAQRALGDREGQRIHHPDEGNDAGRLAVLTDLLADRAHAAPIGADAAAIGGQPDILGPGANDVVQRIADRVQEAGIGRPRSAPPLDSTGVAGMNQRFDM